VLFLLHFEAKQSPDVTRTLWVPTIWFLYIASKPIGLWLPSSYATPDSSPLDIAFLIILMFIALRILIQRRFDWVNAIKLNAWPIILITLWLVSIVWSDIPFVSFKRWIREFQAMLMAFIVLSEPSPHKAMESIIRRMGFILIPFSPVLIKYFPQYGRLYYGRFGSQQWTGVAMQKNGLGCICFIAIFFSIWSILKRRREYSAPLFKYQTFVEIIIIIISLWLMGGPNSDIFYVATAFYALTLGLFIHWGLHILGKRGIYIGVRSLMIVIAVVIIIGIATVFTSASFMGDFASVVGRNSTLTGRTEIWAGLLPIAMQKPILGSGFGGFWTWQTRTVHGVSEAHNGYLEVLLDLGFSGILFVSFFLLSSCQKAYKELFRNFDFGVLWISFIMMTVVYNITASSINSFCNPLMAILLFLSVSSKDFPV